MKKDFSFFDSRQKYLLFVTTINEKTTQLFKKFQRLKNLIIHLVQL